MLTACSPLPPQRLGEAHAFLINEILTEWEEGVHFVVCHGQTIVHSPSLHISWQLFDPWPIVHKLKLPVVYDLRSPDVIAGGEGAPLTPLSDWILFRSETNTRVIVNLGGICNITLVPMNAPPSAVSGLDVGVSNIVIDGAYRHLFPSASKSYDHNGTVASRGHVLQRGIDVAEAALLRMSRKKATIAATAPSLGREDFTHGAVVALVDSLVELQADKESLVTIPPADGPRIAHHKKESGLKVLQAHANVMAELVEAVAGCVAKGVQEILRGRSDGVEVLLAGGGVHNAFFVGRLHHRLGPLVCSVSSTDAVGIPSEAREAVGWAVLGALAQDGVSVTGVTRHTGATEPSAGFLLAQ